MIDANLIDGLVNILGNDEIEIANEVLYAFKNAALQGAYDNILFLVNHGAIEGV